MKSGVKLSCKGKGRLKTCICKEQDVVWWQNKGNEGVKHLHCPYIQIEGPEEPGAQNCIQPQYAPCGHHACKKSRP